jgi:N6-L-threonylcarbamoyladenine synthase
MLILGIETTCDETSCSVVKDGYEILSNVISSQILLHEEYGGVVPEIACRRHIDIITSVLHEALQVAGVTLADIDRIAVAKGPGLIGALLIGLHFAKSLAWSRGIPLVPVNHVEAHLYGAIMSHGANPSLPALGVVLSGGHASLVRIEAIGSYKLIGETIDDAIGEAFDKVAKMLGRPYPGGPYIEEQAKFGDATRFSFKAGKIKDSPLDFSFSGIKTSVLYTIRKLPMPLTAQDIKDISASFQEAVFNDLLQKIKLAIKPEMKAIYLGGGVTQNKRLRALLSEKLPLPCLFPRADLCLDNAAMIAGLAQHIPPLDSLDLDPETRIPFIRENQELKFS